MTASIAQPLPKPRLRIYGYWGVVRTRSSQFPWDWVLAGAPQPLTIVNLVLAPPSLANASRTLFSLAGCSGQLGILCMFEEGHLHITRFARKIRFRLRTVLQRQRLLERREGRNGKGDGGSVT